MIYNFLCDPKIYTIKVSSLRNTRPGILKVTNKSPISHRKAVLEIARYFKRELCYDFVQYDINEDDDCEAFLFLGYPYSETCPTMGACCFRQRKIKDGELDGIFWTLDWIWLHPYVRGNGILKEHWNKFNELYPGFLPMPPFSNAMKHFLLKYLDKENYIYKLLDKNKIDTEVR
jgi:hypothetical protein